MVDHRDEDIGTGMLSETMPFIHGEPLNQVSMNDMNSGAEDDQDLDDSRSSSSPEQLDGDDENMGETSNLIPEQDRFLPIANIGRIMKRAVPSHGKIAKEAKECVQECVSEFISFLTSEASDKCLQEKRKTITVEDMMTAMRNLDLEDYADVLTVYMRRFREVHRDRSDPLAGPGVFADSNTEDLRSSMQSEPSSSSVDDGNGVAETYQSLPVATAGGTEPVVRVLPANAQVLLDASGNQYLTWQGPEGTQIVQVQAANPVEHSTVPLVQNEVAFVSNGSTSSISSQAVNGASGANAPQARGFQSSQQFRPVAPQASNKVQQSQRVLSRGSVSTATPPSRYTRPIAAANNAVPPKRSRDGKTQLR